MVEDSRKIAGGFYMYPCTSQIKKALLPRVRVDIETKALFTTKGKTAHYMSITLIHTNII